MEDLAALASAYWRHHRLVQGTRQERLASQADFWAYDAVTRATWENPEHAVQIIDALLRHPDGDPMGVGCGPIEDLLSLSPQMAQEVARRCRVDPLWRQAVSHAWLDDPIPAAIAIYVAPSGR